MGHSGSSRVACLVAVAVMVLWSGASRATTLYEDWESGTIDPTDWVVWEENPSQLDPQVVSGEGYGGTYGLNVGGAGTNFAGVYSTETFDLGTGSIVFSARPRATQSLSSGQVLIFGIREVGAPGWTAQIAINACFPSGDPTHNTLNYTVLGEQETVSWDSSDSGEFHLYGFAINPDGTVTFSRDGIDDYTSTTVLDVGSYTNESVWAMGIATGTAQNVDNISAVPEPGSMLILGCLGVGLAARWRARRFRDGGA